MSRIQLPRLAPVLLLIGSVAMAIENMATTIAVSERQTAGENQAVVDHASNELSSTNEPIQWDSETLNTQATAALKRIMRLRLESERPGPKEMSTIVKSDVAVGALRPASLAVVYRDEAIRIFEKSDRVHEPKRGIEHLQGAVVNLAQPFAGGSDLRVKFKVVGVVKHDDRAETRVLYQASGQTPDGILQQDATWHCTWVPNAAREPLLSAVVVEDYRETRMPVGRGPLFADCTEAVLGENRCLEDDLAYGGTHWRQRIAKSFNPGRGLTPGLAIGDVNNDGLEDVYFCAMAGLPNRLFLQQPDGTAIDRAAESGVDYLDGSRAALLVDLDNDGDQDLVVVTKTHTLFLANDGRGRFDIRTSLPDPRMRTSLSAVDYDRDGDLDIYVCRYGLFAMSEVDLSQFTDTQFALGLPNPTFDANNGDSNLLLQNNGDFRFTDVTAECGLDANNRRFSYAAAWEDYDNDGDQDLYVANDFGRNNLYRNDGSVFSDVAAEAGVEDLGAGMGITWGDFNNDGWMDLYVSNMFSGAGNRIGLQPEWEQYLRESKGDARAAEELRNARRAMKGNSLYANQGNGRFRDVTDVAGVGMALWSWGGMFVDINNNGREDLVVPNGFFTNEKTKDL